MAATVGPESDGDVTHLTEDLLVTKIEQRLDRLQPHQWRGWVLLGPPQLERGGLK